MLLSTVYRKDLFGWVMYQHTTRISYIFPATTYQPRPSDTSFIPIAYQ